MDESFVFLKRSASLHSRRGSQPINPDEILCHLPKPGYNCLLVTTIIQFIIIIVGCIAFGPLGSKICGLMVDNQSSNLSITNNDDMSLGKRMFGNVISKELKGIMQLI